MTTKPLLVDVYLDSGTCVEVPAGTDLNSPEGYRLLKREAADKLILKLSSGDFDLTFEVLDEGDE